MTKRKTRARLAPAPQATAPRYALIDAARGVAILAMFAYHFSFDLVHFRLLNANPYESPAWITSRTLILGSFLLLVGVSLRLANRDRVQWQGFGRRLAKIAACAALVSLGSYFMFPKSWIYFGVLHHIIVASVLGLAFLRAGWLNLLAGALLIALGVGVQQAAFDAAALNFIGLMTHKPITEDYVPLLPWFGVVLLGIFLGDRIARGNLPWLEGASGPRPLQLMGRHSLLLYMLHQPVFIGLLNLYLMLR